MIRRIIIVQHWFGLTTPKTQRMLASAKAYVNKGLDVYFIYSSASDETPDQLFPYIHFIRVQEKGKLDIKSYRRFCQTVKLLYSNDSVILFYGIPHYAFLFRYPKYNVFAEVTEVPLYGKQSSFLKKGLAHLSIIAARSFAGLFVISKSLEKYYHDRGVINIEIINMFVDNDRFKDLKKRTSERFIGYCGTLSLYKDGVDVLIKAFSEFRNSHASYKLYLFGPFENLEVEKSLKGLVSTLGLDNSVFFTGPISSIELPQYLVNAEILALSRPDNTQAQYGFPTKLGEYLATGNPVVVTCVGEIPLFLKNGVNAFVVEPGNIEMFSNTLCWIADHLDEAKLIAERGRQLVESDFSSEEQSHKAYNYIIKTLTK